MATLKNSRWQRGPIEYRGYMVEIQKTDDGWFARLEFQPGKLMIVCGPWGTADEASHELADSIEYILSPK